jgi:hypothetical protein
MKASVEIVNAFIDGDAGGNPAGVVLDANSLNYDQKLEIAQKADTGNAFTPKPSGLSKPPMAQSAMTCATTSRLTMAATSTPKTNQFTRLLKAIYI